jgi:hypothetical protein
VMKQVPSEYRASGSSSVHGCEMSSLPPLQRSSFVEAPIPSTSSAATLSGLRGHGHWTVGRFSAYRSSRCSTSQSMTCYVGGSPASVLFTCLQQVHWRSTSSGCCPPDGGRTSRSGSTGLTLPSLIDCWQHLVLRNLIPGMLEA